MELYARYGLDQTSGGGASKNEAAMDAGLSEAEIAELEKISGLISKDDAEKLARENQYLGIGNSIKELSHQFRVEASDPLRRKYAFICKIRSSAEIYCAKAQGVIHRQDAGSIPSDSLFVF